MTEGPVGPPADAPRRPIGLATRVLAVLVLVVLTGNLAALLVASAVAPPIFAAHMRQAGHSATPEATHHAEEAFRAAGGISLAVALLAALAVSVGVSLYLTRRLVRSLRPVVRAAGEVARGRYDVTLERPGLGREFDDLSDAFTHMAGQLDRVEETRRRLLGDLAHEVRTPVATLGAYLEAIEDGVASPDAETLAVMRAQVSRLARLAEDVGAVSRADEGQRGLQRRPVPPSTLIADACAAAAERFAAKGVRLAHPATDGLPDVVVDPDRMAQVLGNLLDNALRYTPAGGCVTVVATATAPATAPATATATAPAGRRDGWLAISVADTGAGITAEHLPHVFERFYRADAARDRAHGGSGIGLAIVKALVEAHGGEVTAESPGAGRGAVLTVHLPTADRPGRVPRR